jgi:putative DNA primase/helicase
LSISGEDALTIDRKNLEPLTCRLLSRLMIFTNELPRLGDSSGALANRFILLRLTQSHLGHEDTGLTDKLLAELPGILLWAITGWKQLRERGHFRQPGAAADLIDDLNDLSSPVQQFVRECCLLGPHQARVDDLFTAWRKWCDQVGRKEPGTEQVFGRDLLAAFPKLKRIRPREDGERVRGYEGIAVKTGW